MTVRITIALINEIRDDTELTAMARIIEGAQREAWWQGFGSDWDKARYSAYMLRASGFGRVSEDVESDARTFPTAVKEEPADHDLTDDERHTTWCRGGHEGRCRRGRQTGTEK